MARPQTINEDVTLEVYRLFRESSKASDAGDYAATERLCIEAWSRIPEPKFGWDVSYVCVAGMVKRLRRCGQYDQAMVLVNDYLQSEYHLEYHYGPYFWLGTLHYEKGDMAAAYHYLERANRMSSGRCFVEEDPQYKRFFRTFKTSGKPN